jgi:hypothetical protein
MNATAAPIRRPFYVIAHNPNTLADVAAFLAAGANALEPDVCFVPDHPETYYVSHDHTPFSTPFTAAHSLRAYLAGLRALMVPDADGRAPGGALALIAFDYKDADRGGDINALLRIVDEEFSGRSEGAGVAILVTVSARSHAAFLGGYAQDRPRVGVGIDEDGAPEAVVEALCAAGQAHIAYANGVMKYNPKQVYSSLAAAKALQAALDSAQPQLIYTWVLERDETLRAHLELGLDGVIVDVGTVPRLLAILQEPRYRAMYALAARGHDPWTAPALPQYALQVRTADVALAGTDARLRFTLHGEAGTIERVIDGGRSHMFERDSTNRFSLDGADLGRIQALSIEALDGGLGAGWLPREIELRSRLLASALRFEFGAEDWVVAGKPLTRPAP